MLEARKLNKTVQITEAEKKQYVALGYDVYQDDKVIEYGHGKTVPYAKYLEVVNGLKELKAKTKADAKADAKAEPEAETETETKAEAKTAKK